VTNLELDIRARARGDIDGHTEYFEDRDPELAERFHGELEHVFDRLTSFPGFGQPCPTKKYPDLRRVVLPTLPLSVFYRPTETTIEVFRVLHHARDLARILPNL
jgi:plasmid stabilization system protein ParE